MQKNKAATIVGKATLGVVGLGLVFVLGTSIAGAINKRSFVQEIQSWGQQEQQVEDDKVTDVPENEDQTEVGDEATQATVANVDLENNIILLNK